MTLAEFEQEFLRSDMLTFADAVKNEFVAPVLQAKPEPLHLTGKLSLLPDSKTMANCKIVFLTDWMTTPPAIFSQDVWLRKERDWHVNEKGDLCYVLKDEWGKRIKDVASRNDILGVADYARNYLVRNLRWLLQRHWQGYRENITKWEWDQWSHGWDGVQEFRRQQGQENLSPCNE